MGLTMKDKKALTQELARRYRGSDRKQKTTILDEFVSTTGYRRKYAIHLLANWGKSKTRVIDGELVNLVVGRPKKQKRVGRVIYGDDVRAAVKELWTLFDYMCGKRLVVLIRMNIEALTHESELCLEKEVKKQLMSISAATHRSDPETRAREDPIQEPRPYPSRSDPQAPDPYSNLLSLGREIARILRIRHRRPRWRQRSRRVLLHPQCNRCLFWLGGA